MAEDDDYCLPEEDDVWEEQVDSDHNEPMDMEGTQYIQSDGDTDEYTTINDRYEDRTGNVRNLVLTCFYLNITWFSYFPSVVSRVRRF